MAFVGYLDQCFRWLVNYGLIVYISIMISSQPPSLTLYVLLNSFSLPYLLSLMLLIIYTRTLTELYRYTFSAYTPSTCSKLPLQLNIRADIYIQISTFVYISPVYIVRDRPLPYIYFLTRTHRWLIYIYPPFRQEYTFTVLLSMTNLKTPALLLSV